MVQLQKLIISGFKENINSGKLNRKEDWVGVRVAMYPLEQIN